METTYAEPWSAHPGLAEPFISTRSSSAVWRTMATRYEGAVLYYRLWNFWVRAGSRATIDDGCFFRDYEFANASTDALLRDAGFPWRKAESEAEIWGRIATLWSWLRTHTRTDGAAYGGLAAVPGTWPSIAEYAAFYAAHGHLVWSACFSKAHVFATLLGRLAYPRFRFGIAEGHHTEGGAPPTASHVYVGVYIAERWFYLDPSAVYALDLPDFAGRKSVGLIPSVDYEHPHSFLPVPLSGFDEVPYLPA